MRRLLEPIAFLHGQGGARLVATKLLFWVYDRTIRRLLPAAEPVLLAGIPTGTRRALGDRLLPGWLVRPDIPDFEAGLVGALRAEVRPGDRVTIVGTGNGVTTAVAARAAGEAGRVVAFEGDPAGLAATARTLAVAGVAGRVDLRLAVVGAPVRVYGGAPAGTILAPSDLPDCDVLELDCEGAETLILSGMTLRPRVVAVETHGLYGAPTARVRSILEAGGYRVADLGPAEPRLGDLCLKGDIRVLVGTRDPA